MKTISKTTVVNSPDLAAVESPAWPELRVPQRVETPLVHLSQATLDECCQAMLGQVYRDIPQERLSVREVDELAEQYSEGRVDQPRQANYHDL